MQVVLAASSLAVILLYQYLWVIWIVTCAALAVVAAWPAISGLLCKQSKKNGSTVTPPHISRDSSALGVGGHQVQVDANVGGTGDSLSSHSTQDRARHTYSDHV